MGSAAASNEMCEACVEFSLQISMGCVFSSSAIVPNCSCPLLAQAIPSLCPTCAGVLLRHTSNEALPYGSKGTRT